MSESKPVIGFIGLGLMGSAMATRLQRLGYELVVVAHRNRKPINEAVARGAKEAGSPAELAAKSDIVMICVDTARAVESVMRGDNGVLQTLRPGSLVIDFSTSVPGLTVELAKECRAKGADMMDAPLGRPPAMALEGRLNIMAAGDTELFKRAQPVLADLGENIFHVGPIGAGHTLKLINNFFAMTTACAMSEAFAMSDLAGIERRTLYEVMAAGPAHSVMMDLIKANAVEGDPGKLAFSVANAQKDLSYYSDMAGQFKVPSFISPQVRDLLTRAKSEGWGDKYVPEMVDFMATIFAKS